MPGRTLDAGPPEGPWTAWSAGHGDSAGGGLQATDRADDGYGTGLDAGPDDATGPDGSDLRHHG